MDIVQKANDWLTETFDNETKEEVKALLTEDPKDLEDRFYKDLEFGTGGMRGTMAQEPTESTNIHLEKQRKD